MKPNRNSVYRYGLFLLQWGGFETLLDYLITRELNLKHRKGHILCAGLQFKAKSSILKSLLNDRETPDKVGVKLINDVVTSAKRNFLVHGIPTFDRLSGDLIFTKRIVDNKLKVSEKTFEEDDLYSHMDELICCIEKVEQHFQYSKDELLDFVVTARKLAINTEI